MTPPIRPERPRNTSRVPLPRAYDWFGGVDPDEVDAFGRRWNPLNLRRAGVTTLPAVTTTAQRPGRAERLSGSIDRARAATGTGGIPRADRMLEVLRDNARERFTTDPSARRFLRAAAYADVAMSSFAGGLTGDSGLIGQGVTETTDKYSALTGGRQLDKWATIGAAGASTLVGAGVGAVVGSRAVASGLRTVAGRAAPAITTLANSPAGAIAAGRAAQATRTGRVATRLSEVIDRGLEVGGARAAIGTRFAAETVPMIPVNVAQGAMDSGDPLVLPESMGRLGNVIEAQAMDVLGVGLIEGLRSAVRGSLGRGAREAASHVSPKAIASMIRESANAVADVLPARAVAAGRVASAAVARNISTLREASKVTAEEAGSAAAGAGLGVMSEAVARDDDPNYGRAAMMGAAGGFMAARKTVGLSTTLAEGAEDAGGAARRAVASVIETTRTGLPGEPEAFNASPRVARSGRVIDDRPVSVLSPEEADAGRAPFRAYSPAERIVENYGSARAPAETWRNRLKAMPKAEREWLGLGDSGSEIEQLLRTAQAEDRSLPKDELLDVLQRNGARVQETVFGLQGKPASTRSPEGEWLLARWSRAFDEGDEVEVDRVASAMSTYLREQGIEEPQEAADEMWRALARGSEVQFPPRPASTGAAQYGEYRNPIDQPGGRARLGRATPASNATGHNYREVVLSLAPDAKKTEDPTTPSHFDEVDDQVVHTRLENYSLPNGRRGLYVHEIQSDAAQKGRKHGFARTGGEAREVGRKRNLEHGERQYALASEIALAAEGVSGYKAIKEAEDFSPGSGLYGYMVVEKATEFESATRQILLDAARRLGPDVEARLHAFDTEANGHLSILGALMDSRFEDKRQTAPLAYLGRILADYGRPDRQEDAWRSAKRLNKIAGAVREWIEEYDPTLAPLTRRRDELSAEGATLGTPVVDNQPWKDTPDWTRLAIKRVLAEAAEGGYDEVRFTSDQLQKALYGEHAPTAFYDTQVPDILQRYANQLGIKITLDRGDPTQPAGSVLAGSRGFQITPDVREGLQKAMREGQPLFAVAGAAALGDEDDNAAGALALGAVAAGVLRRARGAGKIAAGPMVADAMTAGKQALARTRALQGGILRRTASIELATMSDPRLNGVELLGAEAIEELQYGTVIGVTDPLAKALGLKRGRDYDAQPSFGVWFGEDANAPAQPSVALVFAPTVPEAASNALIAAQSRVMKQAAMFVMDAAEDGDRIGVRLRVLDKDGEVVPAEVYLDLLREQRAGWNGATILDDGEALITVLDEGVDATAASAEATRFARVLEEAGFSVDDNTSGAYYVKAQEWGSDRYAALSDDGGGRRPEWREANRAAERHYEGVITEAQQLIAAARINARADRNTLALDLSGATPTAAVRVPGVAAPFVGRSHYDARGNPKFRGLSQAKRDKAEDGFVLTTGEFVNRYEADAVVELMAERGDKKAAAVAARVRGREDGGATANLRSEDYRRGAANPGVIGGLGGAAGGAVGGALAGRAGDAAIGEDLDLQDGSQIGSALGALLGAVGGARTLPAIQGALVARQLRQTVRTPAVDAVAKTIASGMRDQRPSRGLLSTAERLYAGLFDDSYAIRKFGRDFNAEEKLTGLDAQTRVSKRYVAWTDHYIREKLTPALQLAKGIEVDVMARVKAERALWFLDNGQIEKTDIGESVLRQTLVDTDTPEIRKAADALRSFYADMVDLRAKEGLLTVDERNALHASEDFYTPFVREWDERGVGGGAASFLGGGNWANSGAGVRKMDREAIARAKTVDPYEQAVKDASALWQRIARQRVAQRMIDVIEAHGGEIPGIARIVPPSTVQVTMPNGYTITQKVKVPRSPTAATIPVVHNGSRLEVEILDEDLFKAWQSWGPTASGPVMAVFRAVKEFKRATITTLPDFALRNLLRDNAQVAMQAAVRPARMAGGALAGAAIGGGAEILREDEVDWLNVASMAVAGTGIGLGASVLVPQLARTMRGVSDILAASDGAFTSVLGRTVGGSAQVWKDFLADGGASIGMYARNTQDAVRMLKNLRGEKASVVNPRTWWEAINTFGEVLENAPRLATYKAALENGSTRLTAAATAADVSLDFSLRGGDAIVRGAVDTTAFFNARLQGWDKVARMLKDPKTFAMGFATITAPSLGIWLLNHQDEETREAYYAHPSWIRNTFWLVPRGDGDFVYIPKPFELGVIFGSLPERALDWAYTTKARGDANPAESAARTAKELAGQVFGADLPLTDAASPIIEQGLNFDLFRNRPIVTGEQFPSGRVTPEAQNTAGTSYAARKVGQFLGLSPQRLEHGLRAYGGSVAALLLRTSNYADPLATDTPTIPIAGDLAKGFLDRKGGSSDDEETVRRRLDQLSRMEQTIKREVKIHTAPEGRYSEAQREAARERHRVLYERYAPELGPEENHLTGLKLADDLLGEIRDAEREVWSNLDYPFAERKAARDFARQWRAKVARAAVAGRYDELDSLAAYFRAGQGADPSTTPPE